MGRRRAALAQFGAQELDEALGLRRQQAGLGDRINRRRRALPIGQHPVPLVCEGKTFAFPVIEPKRCDWCKRYALDGDCGFRYLGSPLDLPAPAVITPDVLADGLRQHDPIKKYRPVVAEPCVINCPLAVAGPQAR